jgi:hypothetical protein
MHHTKIHHKQTKITTRENAKTHARKTTNNKNNALNKQSKNEHHKQKQKNTKTQTTTKTNKH